MLHEWCMKSSRGLSVARIYDTVGLVTDKCTQPIKPATTILKLFKEAGLT